MDFDQPVSIGAAPLELTDAAGRQDTLGRPALSLGGRRLSAPVPERLVDGGYRVRWEVTAQDGDLVSGTVTFAVGAGAAVPAGDTGGSAVDSPLVIVLRWVLFCGLALALGGIVGDGLARRVVREAVPTEPVRAAPPPAVLLGAALGAVAAVGLALDQVGLDVARLTTTAAGQVLAVEVIGFAAATGLALLARDRRAPLVWTVGVPLLAVVVAEGWRAHPHADSPVLGTALTIAHLVAASIWVGALVHVLRAARRWRGQIGWIRLLVYDYARLALILVVLVIATGTAQALIVLPSLDSVVTTTYGWVLLGKLTLVAAVLVLAVLARRRFDRSRRASTVHPLGRVVRGEVAVLAGVLAVTAVLVSVAPARPASTDLAAPPPVSGPIVPAGTLAGQVTVIAAASTGQLVLRMNTPNRHDLGSDDTATGEASAPPTYRVTGVLASDGQDPRALTLRGCGAGCFTTPMDWHEGTNQVRVSIAAPPWHGGVADLTIPWPPRADSHILPTVLAAMRTFPHLIVHEAVTSDYAGYPGTEQPLSMSGAAFLATEPYGSGGGNAVIVATAGSETQIGLAYPQGQVVRLFVGGDYRILREEYVTPNHLITRTFEYPR